VSEISSFLPAQSVGGTGPARTYIILSVLCLVIAFAGAWVNFIFTHLVVWTILLYATASRKIAAKQLILIFLLIGPLISGRFGAKLGPLPDMTFDRLLAATAFIAELSDRRRHGEKWITGMLDRRILMLICACAISIAFASMLKTPIRVLINSLVIPFIVYLMAKRFSRDEWFLRSVYHICVINVLLCGALGMAERFTHRDLLIIGTGDEKFAGGRINGPSGEAEEYGLTMSVMILVITNVGGTLADTRAWVRLRWAAIGLGILAVFNTLTRGIWIALIMGFLAQLALNMRRRVGVVVAIVALFPFALPMSSILLGGDGSSLKGRLQNTETIYARLATFGAALRMFAHRPIIGIGYGTFTEEYESKPDLYVNYFRNVISVNHPHNAYLVTLAETGILGLSFFLVVVGTAFFMARQVKRYDDAPLHVGFANALICILLAYLVDGFGHDFTRNGAFLNKMIYTLIGISAGFVQTLQDKARGAAQLPGRNRE
jgi:O-antigen ligase